MTPSLPFHSILFDEPAQGTGNLARDEPVFFADLNLDQVIGFITRGREEYDLAPFFYTVLHSVETISYRHAILRDLEDKALFGSVGSFAQKMRAMRDHMSQAAKLHYRPQQQSWFLDAAAIYCDAIAALARDLTLAELQSHGLRGFRDYLTAYTQSDEFAALAAETRKLKEQLSGIRYCLHIFGDRIRVTRYDSEADYSADVAATFAKFKQGTVKDYRAKFPGLADMDHVEAGILDGVIQLYPEIFSALDGYCDHHHDYLDRTVAGFDREVQFYVACLEFVRYFGAVGLEFCYPQVSGQSKEVLGRQVFDVALAGKLNARDFRYFRLFGVLWSSCPVSVLMPVFPVALAVSGHGGRPRVAAGLARGSTVRVPGRAGGSSFRTGCFPDGG